MMDLESAIKHCEEVADTPCFTDEEARCYSEHRQLAEWLKELKAYKEQGGDAISRQAVLDIITFEDKWLFDANGHNANTHIAFSGLESRVKALPSVTPQQRTGRWIKYGVPRCGEQHYQCTSCGYYVNFGQWGELYTKGFKNCPNCGAKMEVEE